MDQQPTFFEKLSEAGRCIRLLPYYQQEYLSKYMLCHDERCDDCSLLGGICIDSNFSAAFELVKAVKAEIAKIEAHNP